MEKFKAGDKVIRTHGWDDDFLKRYHIYTVTSFEYGYLKLRGSEKSYYPENFKLVVNESDAMEETETKFEYMKFRIKSEEHSKLIQTELFRLGYSWGNKTKDPKYTREPYIFTYVSGMIAWGDDPSHFKNHPNTEYKLQVEVLPIYTLVKAEPDLVEYNGVKYLKTEFEKVISGLKAYQNE